MYRLKTLTGNCLWARHIASQTSEVAVRVGVINRMVETSLVRNPFISPEIIDPKFVINMPVDAIASLRSIYVTTPSCTDSFRRIVFR
ncbi:MAG: hypothetical protein E5299_01544 [Burkholderia gladioli]|nr:MAG: hypothetical protein E5299_01544 [Burkholderia gladioli]